MVGCKKKYAFQTRLRVSNKQSAAIHIRMCVYIQMDVWVKIFKKFVTLLNMSRKILNFLVEIIQFIVKKDEVLPRFELGLLDSKSKVIAITP